MRHWWRSKEAASDPARNALELVAPFELARHRTATVTMYMCWHGGKGHDFPDEVTHAAGRVRTRHLSKPDDDYTSLHFCPSEDDWNDLLVVLPYCDWAYAADANDVTVAELSS